MRRYSRSKYAQKLGFGGKSQPRYSGSGSEIRRTEPEVAGVTVARIAGVGRAGRWGGDGGDAGRDGRGRPWRGPRRRGAASGGMRWHGGAAPELAGARAANGEWRRGEVGDERPARAPLAQVATGEGRPWALAGLGESGGDVGLEADVAAAERVGHCLARRTLSGGGGSRVRGERIRESRGGIYL